MYFISCRKWRKSATSIKIFLVCTSRRVRPKTHSWNVLWIPELISETVPKKKKISFPKSDGWWNSRERNFLAEFRKNHKRAEKQRFAKHLPLIHVPLKLLEDNEPDSHSFRVMPRVVRVLVPAESSRIAAVITRARTIMTTTQPASKRHRYRCLFFVIRSCAKSKLRERLT